MDGRTTEGGGRWHPEKYQLGSGDRPGWEMHANLDQEEDHKLGERANFPPHSFPGWVIPSPDWHLPVPGFSSELSRCSMHASSG